MELVLARFLELGSEFRQGRFQCIGRQNCNLGGGCRGCAQSHRNSDRDRGRCVPCHGKSSRQHASALVIVPGSCAVGGKDSNRGGGKQCYSAWTGGKQGRGVSMT